METHTIDVVNSISDEAFKSRYLVPQKPLVIRGLTQNTPAGKKWSLDYIKQVCGDVTVDLYDNTNKNEASAFTKPDLKMNFGDYIANISKDQPGSLRMFLFNMFKKKPELRDDFPCPSIMRGVLGRMGFMFFGAKGVNVRIHQDMDMSNVLLTQFYGRKKVILIAPEYSDLLYKLPLNTHSLVNLDQPDYKKYPGLAYIKAYECILEPGDSLFMPSGYWHYITYLDGGFSVSYRKMALDLKTKIQGLLNVFVYMPLDKVLNVVIGKDWLRYKEQKALKRAARAIAHIKLREVEKGTKVYGA
ncbi:MAG: cupin-like domain-containing protein [Bacteroidia bacterium]|nr:cupin-like domain-containing protein [Bacteroidia bacterium]